MTLTIPHHIPQIRDDGQDVLPWVLIPQVELDVSGGAEREEPAGEAEARH